LVSCARCGYRTALPLSPFVITGLFCLRCCRPLCATPLRHLHTTVNHSEQHLYYALISSYIFSPSKRLLYIHFSLFLNYCSAADGFSAGYTLICCVGRPCCAHMRAYTFLQTTLPAAAFRRRRYAPPRTYILLGPHRHRAACLQFSCCFSFHAGVLPGGCATVVLQRRVCRQLPVTAVRRRGRRKGRQDGLRNSAFSYAPLDAVICRLPGGTGLSVGGWLLLVPRRSTNLPPACYPATCLRPRTWWRTSRAERLPSLTARMVPLGVSPCGMLFQVARAAERPAHLLAHAPPCS